MTRAREIRLSTRQGRIAGLGWERAGGPRVLCLHGWLDNAASFLPLAALLEPLATVAIDLPGHGHSAHRHSTARYHFVDYSFDVDATLDALGWQDAHLLGHSLGAAIAAVYAAAAPARVRSATLLDSVGPITADSSSTADRLRRSLARHRDGQSSPRTYASLDEMVAARRRVSDLSERAARLICRRAARRRGDEFVWRSDPALNWVSALMMTEPQVLDLLRHLEAPVLSLMAEPASPWASAEQTRDRLAAIAHGRHETIEGHHHFHMDEPEKVVNIIRQFILENEQPAGAPR
jgi:pimeloyl-ACP methyl ester carboxylesterase